MGWWPDVVLAVLAGPLVVAGTAKLGARGDQLSWPVRRGPLRAPAGPRLVGVAEVLAAFAVVLVAGRAGAVIALLAGVVLTAAAWTARGRACACFGVARLAEVGRSHLVANSLSTAAALAALAGGPGDHLALRAGVAFASAVVTSGVVLALDRRARDEETGSRCDERISAVRLYTTADCPSCRAVKRLLAVLEPARRDAVHTIVLAEGEDKPAELDVPSVPAAVGLDATGRPVCAPVIGIGAVKALIDSISVGLPAPETEVRRGG